MVNNIDLHTLQLDRYEMICELPLEVGYYPGSTNLPDSLAEEFKATMESTVNWQVRCFTSFQHMVGVLSSWTPHILITHWHSVEQAIQEYYGLETSGPEEVVAQFRRRREGERVGKGPFLVGQYTGVDYKFEGVRGEERISSMLDSLYDMLFSRVSELEILPWNIAIGLWNKLREQQGSRGEDVPFDPLFIGYLSGKPIQKYIQEATEFERQGNRYWKLKKEQKLRHEQRVKWIARRLKHKLYQ